MKHIFLIVVISLLTAPVWAGYGYSNIVTQKLDVQGQTQTQNVQQVPGQPAQKAPAEQATPPAAPLQTQEKPAVAAPQAPKQPAAVEFKKTVYYPFTIHISSWKSHKEALDDYAKKYQKQGMIYVTKIDLGESGIWYRIDYGAFTGINEAMQKMKELKNSGLINDPDAFVGSSVPYAIELGVFGTNDEAMAQAYKLQAKGQVVYVIKETNEAYRLLYGSYPSEKSALPARQDLKAMGLQAKIVKR